VFRSLTVRPRPLRRPTVLAAALAAVALAACSDEPAGLDATSFLYGTASDPQVGVVLNGFARTLTLFHAGAPAEQRQIALGASEAITPTGAALRGRRLAVPTGNAASVAIVDLQGARVERVFTFASGNATGAAWVDDATVVAANLIGDYVGRIRLGQSGTAITDTAHVAPAPTAVVVAGGRALVVSGNLDDAFVPLGNGVVSAVDPQTMRVAGTVAVGRNPQAAALGPDGKLYVVNTGDYTAATSSISIVNPQTLQVEATVTGFGAGPGAIAIGADGLAYVSSYAYGTVVWNTATRQFVRGPANPLCAPLAPSTGLGCRGAAHATAGPDGTVYQAYLGSSTDPGRVFAYRRQAGGTYAAPETITAGTGPLWLDVRAYR
jgi:hypothetical protein